jgi:hypothetical protein
MKDEEKIKLENHTNALDDAEGLVEGNMRLVLNWASSLMALTCVILCMPLFGLIDLYRWFKFKAWRKKD